MLKLLRTILQKIITDIDSGNSNISESEEKEICDFLTDITCPYISKYTACNLLHISRSTFDTYVKDGKLPKGIKRQGFKELVWKKSDILQFKP